MFEKIATHLSSQGETCRVRPYPLCISRGRDPMRATALGILTACFQPVDAGWEKKQHYADHPTAHSHRSQAGGQEVEVAGAARFAAAAGCLRARFYDHAKEAELRAAE